MPPQNIASPAVSSVAPKLGKFAASRIIFKESWEILKQDKEIMWFPVISAVVTLLLIGAGALAYFFLMLGGTAATLNFEGIEKLSEGGKEVSEAVSYGMLLVYCIVTFFVANFFQAALMIVVQARFTGQDLGFKDGINGAQAEIGKIFAWSVISATVGLLLQIIADKSKLVGKIVAWMFGAAWNILTYFSLPSLVIGKTDIKDSFKESASIIRKTWGETIIVQFTLTLYVLICAIAYYVALVGFLIFFPSYYAFVGVITLAVVSFFVLATVVATLNSIFKLALYNYARTGEIPKGFSPAVITGAVRAK